MELIGYRKEGDSVVVSLTWEDVQMLLNSAVGQSTRVGRQGKREGDEHLMRWADGALALGNAIEAAWFNRKTQAEERQQIGPHDPNYRYEAA